jgi:hypothetical protein
MDKKELAELLKYSSPRELYVISTHYGESATVVLSFENSVQKLSKKGVTVLVHEIKVTYELKTVYIINNQAYFITFNIIM